MAELGSPGEGGGPGRGRLGLGAGLYVGRGQGFSVAGTHPVSVGGHVEPDGLRGPFSLLGAGGVGG